MGTVSEMAALTVAQLVSQDQVDAARNKMIFWIVFTIAMVCLFVYKLVRLAQKREEDKQRQQAQQADEQSDSAKD